MKNQTLSFSLLLIFSFMLILAGSYLSNLQNWLAFSSSNESVSANKLVNQSVSYGFIHSISSSPTIELAIDLVHLEGNEGYKASENSDVSDVNESNHGFEGHTPVASPIVPEIVKISSDTALTRPGQSAIVQNPISREPLVFPTFIEYADELVLEFPETFASKENLKRAISKVLLSVSEVDNTDLLSLDPIRSQYQPFYYNKVKNQYGRAIRYPADASAYADYLLKKQTDQIDDSGLKFTAVHIPLANKKLPINVQKYRHWVEDSANRFKVSSALVFAIIEVESAFNPQAVSKSNALGLMQLKANTAGRDVYHYIDGKQGQPGQAELFDAPNNIRMGTAYMGLLKHNYLQGVHNADSKEMLAVASYNGGISTVLKLFGKTAALAIKRVNQLHPKQLYQILRYEHPSKETRHYLDKVLAAQKRYQQLFKIAV